MNHKNLTIACIILFSLAGCDERALYPESDGQYVHLNPGAKALCLNDWEVFTFETNIPDLEREDLTFTFFKNDGENLGTLTEDGIYVAPRSIEGTSKEVVIRAILKSNPTINAFTTMTIYANESETFINRVRAFGSSENDKMQALPTKNGSFILIGSNSETVPRPIQVLNIDLAGFQTWQRDFGTGSAFEIIQSVDGGFLISGNKYDLATEKNKALLFKIDAGGNFIWETVFSGGEGRSLASYADGNIVVSTTADDGSAKIILHGRDRRGNALWSKEVGNGISNGLLASDRNHLALSSSNFDVRPNEVKVTILDENIETITEKTFRGNSAPILKRNTDGGYIIGTSSLVEGNYLMNLYFIDEEGTLEKEINIPLEERGKLIDFSQTEDKGFILAGISFDGEKNRPIVLRLDQEGSFNWKQSFGEEDESGIAFSVAEALDGGFLILGRLATDDIIIKLDESGGISPCAANN